MLAPVAAGNYDLVIKATARASMVLTGVPVTAGTMTAVSTSATPLTPVAAVDGQVMGSVKAADRAATASLRATQQLSGGRVVTIAETMSDSTTGDYTLRLPAAPPWVATYATPPAALNFVAGASGVDLLYTLNASLNGTTQVMTPVAVTAGGVTPVNFSF